MSEQTVNGLNQYVDANLQKLTKDIQEETAMLNNLRANIKNLKRSIQAKAGAIEAFRGVNGVMSPAPMPTVQEIPGTEAANA